MVFKNMTSQLLTSFGDAFTPPTLVSDGLNLGEGGRGGFFAFGGRDYQEKCFTVRSGSSVKLGECDLVPAGKHLCLCNLDSLTSASKLEVNASGGTRANTRLDYSS
jgi:hypothetical protein